MCIKLKGLKTWHKSWVFCIWCGIFGSKYMLVGSMYAYMWHTLSSFRKLVLSDLARHSWYLHVLIKSYLQFYINFKCNGTYFLIAIRLESFKTLTPLHQVLHFWFHLWNVQPCYCEFFLKFATTAVSRNLKLIPLSHSWYHITYIVQTSIHAFTIKVSFG